jgi:hypothetical protein
MLHICVNMNCIVESSINLSLSFLCYFAHFCNLCCVYFVLFIQLANELLK